MLAAEDRPLQPPAKNPVPPMNPHWLTLNWFVVTLITLLCLVHNSFFWLGLYGVGLGVYQICKRYYVH